LRSIWARYHPSPDPRADQVGWPPGGRRGSGADGGFRPLAEEGV